MDSTESAIAKLVLQPRRVLIDGVPLLSRESIDGRPLYKYRISNKKLDALEREISNPKCKDAWRVLILAPLAAGRFAQNYDGGSPSWDHCGEAVKKLYRPGDKRFKELMADSLRHYRIEIIGSDDSEFLFQTIIRESGLPSPMLASDKPLRRLLDDLMDRAARGEDVIEAAVNLVLNQDWLPKRYKDAGHLPRLCADLVMAVDKLKQASGWNGGTLDPIWGIPNWDRKLPFLVTEEKAKEIVGCLLHVAEAASESNPLSIERLLCRAGGSWQLQARVAFPQSGHEIEYPNFPDLLSIRYTVDGEPTDEACRIRRHGGQNLYKLAREARDLSEVFASSSRNLALSIEAGENIREKLNCQGGERLTPELPWIFKFRTDGKHAYLDSGDRRSRSTELLVAALPGTTVAGIAALLPGTLDVKIRDGEPAQQRSIWRVQGVADFSWEDGEARIEAGYTGPDVHLQFSGRGANVHVHGCAGAYISDPKPKRVGGLSGSIQWRSAGASQWSAGVVRVTGKVTYRLVDEAGLELAKRNVFIFPETFDYRVLHKHVELTLGDDCLAVGAVSTGANKWIVEFGAQPEIMVPIVVAGVQIDLRFEKPRPTSFVNVANGEQLSDRSHVVSSRIVGALVARSNQHDHILVRRVRSAWNSAHPFPLANNQLRLSDIKNFLNALAFDYQGRTNALRIEFPNQAGLEIQAYRCIRQGSLISIPGANDGMSVDMVELAPETGQDALNHPAARVGQDCWEIPPLREGRLYLAVDASHQAAPCLVGEHSPVEQGGQHSFLENVALTDERERSTNLLGFFRRVTSEPGEEFNAGQIDVCLDWMGRFQHVLTWLHPFLVLAPHPDFALKILILARLRGHIKAEQGLRWSLDEVPLFWHQLAGLDSAEIASWNHTQLPEETRKQAHELIKELPFQEILEQLSSSPLPLLQATHSAWRDEWQRRVQSWGDQANGHLGARSSEIARSAELLWNSLAEAPELKSLLEMRCQQVPEGIEEVHRTYLLAPFELAASIVHCLELPAHLRDDLIYARYVISPDAFDSAFCVAKILMERMK